jgi:hypothetical protein
MMCSYVDVHRYFGRIYGLHLWGSNSVPSKLDADCLPGLLFDPADSCRTSCETSVNIYWTLMRHITKESALQSLLSFRKIDGKM